VNVGFARANNRVIRRAISRGDPFVFLLNEDTRLDPDTLATLVDVAERRNVSILSPLQYDYEGRAFEDDFESSSARNASAAAGKAPSSCPPNRIIGAAVLMRLSTLRRIGMFDPTYFLYAEEEDLCRRALSHGYAVGITPRAADLPRAQGDRRLPDARTREAVQHDPRKYVLMLKTLGGRSRARCSCASPRRRGTFWPSSRPTASALFAILPSR